MPGNHLVLLPDEPTFTITAVSDDYLRAVSIQRETLVGGGIFDVLFREESSHNMATQLRQSLVQVIQARQTHLMADQHYEWPYLQTSEQEWRVWRPVNKPVIGNDGKVAFIIHTIEDITPQVQLMEVAESNRYLQTIINLFKEPLQVLQPVFEQGEIVDFRFKFTNQAYASYASTTPEQLQGKRVGEVFPGYLETVSFTNPVKTFTTGKPLTFDIHYDKDGLDLYNVMSTFKLDEEVVIHFTDFTRVKQLQGQLESKIEELNRSNNNLEQFASIASHDLQEPLRKIQSFSALLTSQLEGQLTDISRDYLQRINLAVSRMSTLITDLLAYSRLSTVQQKFAPVSLSAVVADVLTTLDWTISQRQAQVEVYALPTVDGEAWQLGQLFQNLLSNALKFSRPDHRPRVEVKSIVVPRSELPREVRPKSAATLFHQISVRDQGIGFDPQYVDRIFQVFQRLHGKNEYAGTGVGLAICQQVATNHGGGITATSKPGEGATFWVYLPAE
ncbi:hypothetical protein GCM10028805_15990 [Spirosoma harenae]